LPPDPRTGEHHGHFLPDKGDLVGKTVTFYFSDAELLIHERAKGYATDLSTIVIRGLLAFVEAKESEARDMQDHIYFIGKKADAGKVTKGKVIRFTARKLAKDVKRFDDPDKKRVTTLFYTSKQKYLILSEYKNKEIEYTNYFICNTVQEMCKDLLPFALISAAVLNERNMPLENLELGE
jgi:hypothetical protein